MVAFTTHEDPALPGVRLEPLTEHVPDTTCHETTPVPEPPPVVNDKDWPYVAAVDVTDNVACDTREIARVPLLRVSEYRFVFPTPYDTDGMIEYVPPSVGLVEDGPYDAPSFVVPEYE